MPKLQSTTTVEEQTSFSGNLLKMRLGILIIESDIVRSTIADGNIDCDCVLEFLVNILYIGRRRMQRLA